MVENSKAAASLIYNDLPVYWMQTGLKEFWNHHLFVIEVWFCFQGRKDDTSVPVLLRWWWARWRADPCFPYQNVATDP